MNAQDDIRLPKWPFYLGDAVMLGVAYFVFWQHGHGALSLWECLLIAGCGAGGAIIAVLPFVLEYRAAVRRVEAGMLAGTVAEIRNLEMIAAQIAAATARWQVVQEHSANSVTASRRMFKAASGGSLCICAPSIRSIGSACRSTALASRCARARSPTDRSAKGEPFTSAPISASDCPRSSTPLNKPKTARRAAKPSAIARPCPV